MKNERGKFVLNLLPSGILRPNVVCVMGNGMVIDPHHLAGEIESLRKQGVEISPANLKISDRATITMPYHVEQDGLEEARLSKTGAQFGSTKRGIAYAYGDKYMKKTLRMGDLLHLDDSVKKRLVTMVDSKNLVMEGSYNAAPISVDEMWAWLEQYAAIFKDYICDVGQYLADADAAGKKVLFEAQLGALRDIDFGIYPYTTSSNVIGAYAPIGAGIPGHKLHNSIGVMKAYSSCVGDGPFTAELAMTEEEKHALREAGHEYGAATGRPRRVGPIDLVASRYGVFCQGCDEVALTLLDVLDYMEKIPMVTAYKLSDGTTTTRFPMGEALDTAQPVVEYLPAGTAISPQPASGRTCPRRPVTMWSAWKRLWAARSPISRSARSVRLISTRGLSHGAFIRNKGSVRLCLISLPTVPVTGPRKRQSSTMWKLCRSMSRWMASITARRARRSRCGISTSSW